ncbi:MAG TPA: hypothetical protein VGS08_04250 [Candidatus Saccharimonadales bacterium]|nr:hypothetical protein [Candidatus Saccharimonadales bacterium]
MMGASPFYPFPPRPGIYLEAVDLEARQLVLTDAELQQVIGFEHSLYNASLDEVAFPSATEYQRGQDALGTPLQPLEAVWELEVNSSQLGINYFTTSEGRAALHELFGVQLDEIKTPTEITTMLASLDTSSIESSVLDKLEADSVGYEEKRLTEAFKANGYQGEDLPSMQLVKVYKNPEVLVTKAYGYRQLKTYLGQVKADIQTQALQSNPVVSKAQLILVDKYRQRINRFLADTYIEAYELLGQYRASGETTHISTINNLEHILPAFSNGQADAKIAGFLQRMDRYRYGVAQDDRGNFTWLSAQAGDLVANASEVRITMTDREMYEDIDPESLKSTMIDGTTFRDKLLAPVLRMYGVLSTDVEWDSERIGPAADGKWQIIVSDKFKSLAVNDRQRIMKVPAKFTSLMAAVTVGNHEIVHVLQHENKRALGELAILQKIGLDAASEQAEAGGMWQQNAALGALSGMLRDHVSGMGYYKNLQIKARGGSFGECVQAYYESLRSESDIPADRAAAQAVNRARRVFRLGGFAFAQNTSHLTNTQPLNYLEQQLIYGGLDTQTRKLLLVGGITIASLVELREYGLVDTNNITMPDNMPWQLMYPAVKELLAKKDT